MTAGSPRCGIDLFWRSKRGFGLPGACLILALIAVGATGCADRTEDAPIRRTVNVPEKYERDRVRRPNRDIWVAALQTTEFLRKQMVDPFGGIIATDWYTPKSVPNERFRITIAVTSPALSDDSLKVIVFKQVRSGGRWRSSAVSQATVSALISKIMSRARIRVAGKAK
jgi:Domain of unknown function (DUF3576)